MYADDTLSWLGMLDELRTMAQLGLNYTQDPFDRRRYERILELCAGQYAPLADLPADLIRARFQQELGHITPKVGVDGAVFDADGKILLVQRADDGCWCLPGGWADVGESAQDSVCREIREESGLLVRAEQVIDVFTRLPGQFAQPYTTYHLLFYCQLLGGEPAPSEETTAVGFFAPATVSPWHRDHRQFAERAFEFWRYRHASAHPDRL